MSVCQLGLDAKLSSLCWFADWITRTSDCMPAGGRRRSLCVSAAERGGEAEPGSAQSSGRRVFIQRDDLFPQKDPPGGVIFSQQHTESPERSAEDAERG